MKKIVILTIVVLVVFIVLYPRFKKSNLIVDTPSNSSTSDTITSFPSNLSVTPSFAVDKNNISYVTVRNIEKIELYTNLGESKTSFDFKEFNSCIYLTSGGFYGEDNKHIGLFVSKGNVINKSSISPTFNGFFSISNNNMASISYNEPQNPEYAVQSGPMLYVNSEPLALKIKNDERARRVVVAINRLGHAIFIVFYNPSQTLDGPLLSELPELLSGLEKNTNLDFEYAMNLDGGAHSTFITDSLKLTELSTAGGYFCIKP